MAATNRLIQDFIEFATDADPGVTDPGTLSAPGLADLVAVADPDFVALTLDPDAENGDPEIVWVTTHTASATTATIARAQEGTSVRAHPVGTKVVAALTASAFVDPSVFEVDDSVEASSVSVTTSYTNIVSLSLSIPAAWNSWKCVAWASYGVSGALNDRYDVRLVIDGTAQQAKENKQIPDGAPTVAIEGAIVGRREGITTTGSRSIALEGREDAGSTISFSDPILYARAVRTS